MPLSEGVKRAEKGFSMNLSEMMISDVDPRWMQTRAAYRGMHTMMALMCLKRCVYCCGEGGLKVRRRRVFEVGQPLFDRNQICKWRSCVLEERNRAGEEETAQ